MLNAIYCAYIMQLCILLDLIANFKKSLAFYCALSFWSFYYFFVNLLLPFGITYRSPDRTTYIVDQMLKYSILTFSDVITLSSEGSILRAWSLPDGQMVWESFLQGSKPSKSLLSIPVSECL